MRIINIFVKNEYFDDDYEGDNNDDGDDDDYDDDACWFWSIKVCILILRYQ